MTFDVAIARAKHAQAAQLMSEYGLDCWIIQFARETGLVSNASDYLIGTTITWPSAFLVNRDGRTAAIVGSGDLSKVAGLGLWDHVRGYRDGIQSDLLDVLRGWGAERVGIAHSDSDYAADTITHGMYLQLQSLLMDGPHLVDAAELAAEVRRRKLPVELDRLRSALGAAQELLETVPGLLRPGVTEFDVHHALRRSVREAGWAFAGDDELNPIVNIGPVEGIAGHTVPGDHGLEPGDLIHVDLALAVNGYGSDLQRTWYVLRSGETEPPVDVARVFDTVMAALDAGIDAIRPGVQGHEVDAEGRRVMVEAGYPTPPFAFGHHVGRVAHDGGGMLAPLWPRYGSNPTFVLRPGQVFAVEVLQTVPGHGVVGLEEEVLVTQTGGEVMSSRQRALRLLRAAGSGLAEIGVEAKA